MGAKNDKKCLIIGPIGKEGSSTRIHAEKVYGDFIKPVIEKYGYTVDMAHKIFESGQITIQVFGILVNADVVIADLTDQNPNVLYELGLRHAMGKPVIQVMKEGQELPFNIKDIRTIMFKLSDHKKMKAAKKELEQYIKKIEKGYLERTVLNLLLEKGLDYHAELLDPTKWAHYKRAWGGFTGDYCAFNPTFIIEETLSDRSIAAAVFRSTFRNNEFCKARYLIFMKKNDANSFKSMQNFQEIVRNTRENIGKIIDKKFEVRIISDRKPPSYEFYLGEKEKTDTAIVDFQMPPLVKTWGIPSYVFVIHNSVLIQKLKDEFYKRWINCKDKYSIEEFLDIK